MQHHAVAAAVDEGGRADKVLGVSAVDVVDKVEVLGREARVLRVLQVLPRPRVTILMLLHAIHHKANALHVSHPLRMLLKKNKKRVQAVIPTVDSLVVDDGTTERRLNGSIEPLAHETQVADVGGVEVIGGLVDQLAGDVGQFLTMSCSTKRNHA